jgi:SAM-dependent methyltransferase
MPKLNGSMTEKILWDFYAMAYDGLARYYAPYGEVMDEAEKALTQKGKHYKTVFDAGCGTGELAIRLLKRGKKITCLDVSSSMLALFKKKLEKFREPGSNCLIYNGNLNDKLEYNDDSFDAVSSIHSLFMLDDKFRTLDELDRVLKPGGRMVIAHVKPVSIPRLLELEYKENGIISAVSVFFKLFNVGLINILVAGRHKKVYGITPADDIIIYMKKKGYSLFLQKILYRGFDDFMVFDKKAENGPLRD